MKLKSIAAAVALACGAMLSVQAQATVSTDGYAGGEGNGTGNGGMFLSIYDPGNSQSLFFDLQLSVNDFRNTNASLIGTFSRTNSLVQNFLSSSSDLGNVIWNVGGMSNVASSDFGVIASYKSGTAITDPTFTSLSGAMSNAYGYVTGANNVLVGSTNTDHLAVYGDITFLGNGHFGAGLYGTNYGAGIPFNDTGNVGDALLTSFVHSNDTFDATGHAVFTAGQWKLDAGTGTVSYVAPAPVPVPAAAWLFGSALVGLTGISRRRKPV